MYFYLKNTNIYTQPQIGDCNFIHLHTDFVTNTVVTFLRIELTHNFYTSPGMVVQAHILHAYMHTHTHTQE